MADSLTRLLIRWTQAGVIDDGTAERIRAFEQSRAGGTELRWPIWLALAFGGVMIGAAVLLFVSANWDNLSPFARLALVGLLVAVFHVAGAAMVDRSPGVSVTLHAVGTVAFGAGLFLCGQIFNLAEPWPRGLMLWAIGAAPDQDLAVLKIEVFLGVFIGAVTFTGSVVAYGKLAGVNVCEAKPAQRVMVDEAYIAAVRETVREQAKKHKGKGPAAPSAEQVEVERLQAEKAERDRALAAERNAQLRQNEAHAQVRQIVEAHKVKRDGEIAYRFTDGGTIRDVLVNEALRAQLASGTLVIVRHDQGYELLPRVAADKVYERDATAIVLDHARSEAGSGNGADDDYYKQFQVPDDLIW